MISKLVAEPSPLYMVKVLSETDIFFICRFAGCNDRLRR